jgi:protein ImuB
MAFAAIYVPEFMVQAVVRAEGRMEGGAEVHAEARPKKPAETGATIGAKGAIALIDGNPPLWSVVAANSHALAAGIVLGMTKATAAQFAGVELRVRSLAAERAAHAALCDAGWSVSPRLEDTAPDLVVVDIAGLSALLGSEETIAALLTARAADCGLRVNVAIAEQLPAAEIAARGFAGSTLLAPGTEAAHIGKLSIHVLSPPEEMAETLALWGIRTCAELARLPKLQLSERLGQPGLYLRALARGTATRALAVAEPELTFAEEMELDDAVEELEPLSFVLGRLLDQLCARLMARALAASLLRLHFDLQPAFENALDVRTEVVRAKRVAGVYEHAMQLPVPMRDAKLLLKLLRLRLQGSPPGAPIVKVRISAEAAPPRMSQHGLFLSTFPDAEKLELTLARLANLVGEDHVGSAEVLDTYRPGDFRMQKFAPANEEPGRHAKKRGAKKSSVAKENGAAQTPHSSPVAAAALSFRVFRPPLPVTVKQRDGQPAEVILQGRRGEVCNASGPWRTSGEWWRAEQWNEDEWDVEVQFAAVNARTIPASQKGALQKNTSQARAEYLQPEMSASELHRYRLYFDLVHQSWFARGMYD